jgi:predicted Ser/Thr protein kinase
VTPLTGKTIGKYRVLAHVGAGGMGTVYKALDETLEREVAIKVLNPGLTDPKILTRFRVEATTLAKLNHPAIATIYELFECGDDLFIVMEFVRGETLERLTQRVGRLVPEQAVFIVDRVLAALAHTHRAGIVHCDIKPGNVMVTAQRGVKIMDFGTARVRGAEHGGPHGYMMGTPAYMPPEQLLGESLDGRTDLYAVGVLFYRLITGTLPFTADTPIDAMRRQINHAPTPAIHHRPDLPDWCDYILTRALAKAPVDRFQTAEGFRDALRDASGFTAEPTESFMAPIVDLPGTSPEPTIVERLEPPPGEPSRVARPLALLVAAAISVLAVTPLRAPSAGIADAKPFASVVPPELGSIRLPELVVPAMTLPESGRTAAVRAPVVYAFEARVVAGDHNSQQQCKCRVVLANGRMIWRAEDDRRRIDAVPYDRVASMVYSHGRDPLWNGPGGPTPVVRASHGPFAAFGFFSDRDWLSLRVTDPHLRFVVLRFDDVAQARSAINALEERTGRRIERLPKRQS